MKCYGKAEEAVKDILEAFQNPNKLPGPLAQIFICRKDNVPCRSWSWRNQLLVALHGHSDARGYRVLPLDCLFLDGDWRPQLSLPRMEIHQRRPYRSGRLKRVFNIVANVLGGLVLVMLLLDPTRPLAPVLVVLGLAVVFAVVPWFMRR
jgi:hypothetical protein